MADAWNLDLELSFLAGLELLRPRDVDQIDQIRAQIAELAQDPRPDHKRKRHVKKLPHVYQLSVGDVRIFYSFAAPRVTVLAAHRRGDRGYYDFIMGERCASPDAWRVATRSLAARLSELEQKEQRERAPSLDEVELAELRTLRAAFRADQPGGLR